MRRPRLRLLVLVAALEVSAACRGAFLGGGGSAATVATPPDLEVTALCATLTSAYAPARAGGNEFAEEHEHGLHLGWAAGERSLFFRLTSPNATIRRQAARRLLARAPTRSSASLESAIAVSGSAGDFAVLPYLEGIVTNRFPTEDDGDDENGCGDSHEHRSRGSDTPCDIDADADQPRSHSGHGGGNGNGNGDGNHSPHPIATSFALGARTAAAAAIGRIIELDHPHPTPTPEPGEPDTVGAAVAALELGSCSDRVELRSAALEALGLTRSPAAKPFLDKIAANPAQDDDFQNLFLQTIAARSLTNITWNNHVQTLGLQPRIDAAFQQAQSTMVTP